jgi:hypothetical protein
VPFASIVILIVILFRQGWILSILISLILLSRFLFVLQLQAEEYNPDITMFLIW